MSVEALLTLASTPDLDPLLNEPLYYEWCFILASPESVKHKYKQDVEFAAYGLLLDLDDRIALVRADLITGYAFFAYFVNDLPVGMSRGVFPAGDPLHRDIVMIDLAYRGNPVKA